MEEPCWVCDRQIFSLIFWNEYIGYSQAAAVSIKDRNFLINKIKEWNRFEETDKTENTPYPGNQTVFPTIYGDFTNWKPKRMFEIREYCDRINSYKPNIFELCKQNEVINPWANSIKDLKGDQMQRYQREVKMHYDSYRTKWKDIIQGELKYKNPHIVNANFKGMIENQDVPLFVYPCFMKSSKQYYAVKYQKTTNA